MLNESEQASFARVSFIVHGPKYDNTSSGIERHMLLTKNAHIKRPRNAWIYVSHYNA
jgi:hypothetical protein